jgi:ubiquinone/menaquinone biosynthesis C-methylase UbiE
VTHKFDVSKRNKLDNPERRAILPPEETLRKLGLQEGEIMADIGCGIGYFTFPVVLIIGLKGKVYALDVSPEMLAEIEMKKVQDDIHNIEAVKVDEYDLKLESGTVTLGFVSNVLHEIDNLERYLTEIRRIINDKGKLFVIEWEKRVSDFGPPLDHRLDKKDLVKALEVEGFINIETLSLGVEFYAVKAQKG